MAGGATSAHAARPAWNDYQVATFAGQHDTHIETGDDYDTLTLATLFALKPQAKPKMAGNAFLPSSYHDCDARSHEVQRNRGSFVALVGDIDKGDLSPETVQAVTERFVDGAAWLIYSSAHSRDGDRRWRVIVPLCEPIGFADWYDAQTAFFTFMEGAGVPMDHAMSRAAQPVYLPNVPHAYKDGTPLRDQTGEPIYYRTQSTGTDAPGLDIMRGAISGGIASIRQQRAADDREREILRKTAVERFANRPQTDGGNIIDGFNESTSIATMLELCGYEQSPRSGDDWRSPQQTGETYATRIIEGKWVSLSASDAASGVGSKCKSGCFGDAYDLYVHYKHAGDHKSAYRELGREQRGHNVVQGRSRDDGPIWQDMPQVPPLAAYEEDVAPRRRQKMTRTFSGDDFGADADMIAAEDARRQNEMEAIDEAFFDPSAWQGVAVPPREWMVPDWVPLLSTTFLTGLGATGKSLMTQQLATCVAMGIKFLGLDVRQCRAAYITCEDDMDELHRRQDAINAMLGITMADLAGKLLLRSLKGEQHMEFATFDDRNVMTITPRYKMMEATLIAADVKFSVFDNVAHLFAGNENIRGHVAQFCGLMDKLAMKTGGSNLLLGHPNKAGAEFSGSTAWENQVRSRIYLKRPDNQDGSANPDERILSRSKPNYAQMGEEVSFIWQSWAFTRVEDIPTNFDHEMAVVMVSNSDNDAFLNCLRERDKQGEGRQVGPSPGPNYAPKQFEGMAQAKGLPSARLKKAMDRLFTSEQIESYTYRNTSKGRDVTVIRERSPSPRTPTPNPSRTVSRTDPEPFPNAARTTPRTHSIYKYIGDGAHEAPPSPLPTEEVGLGRTRFPREQDAAQIDLTEVVFPPDDEPDPAADVYR